MTAAAPQIAERKDNNNQVKTEGTGCSPDQLLKFLSLEWFARSTNLLASKSCKIRQKIIIIIYKMKNNFIICVYHIFGGLK